MVQTFKRAIERMHNLPIQDRFSKFQLTYRLTPHTTTGVVPAELLMGLRPCSLLDNLIPDLSQKVEYRQVKQKLSHDSSKSVRNFEVGDIVFAETFTGKSPKRISRKMREVTGPLSYVVELTDGRIMRRHVDSIRRRHGIDIARDTPAKDPHPLAIPPPDLSRMTKIPPSAPPITLSSQSSTLASQRTRITASHPLRQSTRKCQRPDYFTSK